MPGGWARIRLIRDTGECTIAGMTTTNRSYKSGQSRDQASFLPPCLEDYVGRDNPVRAVDVYVDSLDLHALGFRDVGSDGGAGQPLGDTVFANTIAAYEVLPASMKTRLAGLTAIHRYAARRRVADSPRPKLTQAQLDETPDVAHPIVRTHPYTGRKSLYVTAGECVGIEGMPEDEAVELIAELDAHCVRPEFLYRHKWQVGDLLMWDNTSAMHLAICDYALPERRLMHRTTVIGTVPI